MTFQPDSVKAAVFDIGGVFTYPDYRPVADRLTELGLETPSDVTAYRRAHHRAVRALADAARPTKEDQPSFWDVYDHAYAGVLGVPEQHVEELRIAVRVDWNWVHEQNVAAFHRLAATGLPVAIVSNNNGTAPAQMTDYGVCQVGDGPLPSVAAIVDSTLVGVAKPDPAIFTPALDALGFDPAAVLYVGDTVHADVAGATNAGMQVVQLDPFDDHADFDHAKLVDLDQLVTTISG